MNPHQTNHRQQTNSQSPAMLAALAALALLLGATVLPAGAGTINWNGQDANGANGVGNFSYCDNWYGANCPPAFGGWVFGNDFHFSYNQTVGGGANGHEYTLTNDYSSWTNIGNIYWDSSFSSPNVGIELYSANGAGLNFDGKIENDWAGVVTNNMPTSGAWNSADAYMQLNPVAGDMIFLQPVYNDNHREVQVWGGTANNVGSAHKLVLQTDLVNGQAGNAGVDMNLEDDSAHYGIVDVKATQTWGGSTNIFINAGELWMDTGGNLATGQKVNVGDGTGSTPAKLWLVPLAGGINFTNPIVTYQSGTVERTIGGLNTSGTDTFYSPITLNGQINLSAATGGTVNFAGPISGSGQNVVINGFLLPFAGVIQMSATNTYSGNTYVSGGTLQLNATGSISNSPNLYLGELSGTNTATLILGAAGGGQSLTNSIYVRAGSSGIDTISSLATSGVDALTGGINLSNNLVLNAAGGGSLFLGGPLTGTNALSLTLAGSGTVILTNGVGNTFSGPITVNAGELTSTYGASFKNLTNTITVASGAALVLNANYDGNAASCPVAISGTGNGSYGVLDGEYNMTLNAPVTLNAGSAISHSWGNFILNGPIIASGSGQNLVLNNYQSSQPSMTVGASMSLGTGILTLNGVNGAPSGQGGVFLNASNNYSGGTILNSGNLQLGNAKALGTGGLTVNGGLANLNGNSVSLASLAGSGGLITDNASGTGPTAVTVNQSAAATFSGFLNNGATRVLSLTLGGTGALTLLANNTYSGATTVNAGELIGGTSGSAANSSVTVAAGATNGIQAIAYGGNWSCAGLAYNPGTTYLDLNLTALPVSTTSAPLLVNGNLTANGTVNILVRNGYWPATGTYPLVSYTGTLTGGANFALLSLPAGVTATLVNNTAAKRLDLNVTAVPAAGVSTYSTWTNLVSGNAGGLWGTALNWSSNTVPNAVDAVADFSTLSLTVNSTVTNDANRTVGTLKFDNTSSSYGWTVTSNTLTLAASVGLPSVSVVTSGRNATLASGLAGTQGFIKNGAGTLTLSGGASNTIGGPIVVAAGTLTSLGGISLASTAGSISVASGAVLDLNNNYVGGTVTNALYLSGTGNSGYGALDLRNNQVISGPITLQNNTLITVANNCAVNGIISAVNDNLQLYQISGQAYSTTFGSINLGTGALTLNSVLATAGQGFEFQLNAANSYSGGTVLTNYAAVRLNNAGALGSGGLILYSNSVLDLYANNITIPSLSGPSSGSMITDSNGTAGTTTLTVNQSAATTYSGAINNGSPRTLALTLSGPGALSLAGTNNYTGLTTVSVGELVGATGGSCSNSIVTVAAGATNGVSVLSANGQWTCAGLTNSTSTGYMDFNLASAGLSTTAAPLKVNGPLTVSSSLKIIVRGLVGVVNGQYPLIKYTGTLSGTPPSTALSLPPGVVASISNNTANSSIDLVVTSPSAVYWAVGSGTWDLNTSLNWKSTAAAGVTNAYYLDGETVTLDDSTAGNSPYLVTNAATVSPASLTVSTTNSYAISGSPIAGSGALTKSGTGTLTLSGTNNYTGAATVNAGELIGVTGGSCSNSAVTVAAGATNGVLVATAGGQWASGALTYNSGTTWLDINFTNTLPSTTIAPLLVNGNLALNGTVNFMVRNGLWSNPGTYPLVSYTGALSGTVPGSVFALAPGLTATLVNNTGGKRIDLSVSAVSLVYSSYNAWTNLVSGNAGGIWGTNSNWKPNTVPNGVSAVADFSTVTITANSFVTNDTPHTVGELSFANGSGKTWTLDGTNAQLTLAAGDLVPPINVTNTQVLLGGFNGANGLVKNGPGALAIYGLNYSNSLAGPIQVNAGLLGTVGSTAFKYITGPITVASGASFEANADYQSTAFANPIYLSGTGCGTPNGYVGNSATPDGTYNGEGNFGALDLHGNVTYSGTITLNASSLITHGYNVGTITGPIVASGAGQNLQLAITVGAQYPLGVNSSINLGTGTLTINSVSGGGSVQGWSVSLGAANTYSGGTILTNYGILQLGNAGALGSGGLTLYTNSVLNLNTYSIAIPSLTGLGGLITDNNGGAGTTTLTVNQSVATTYSGAISNGAARTVALTLSGAGALTLSGTNTYTGATALNAGELIGVTGGSCSNSALTVASGATNAVQAAAAGGQWACSNLTYSSGTTYLVINFGGATPSTTLAPLLVNGNLTNNGTLNVLISSSTGIADGVYPLIKYTGTNNGTMPVAALALPTGWGASLSNDVANKSLDLVVTSGTMMQWAVGNGAWDINTTANWKDPNGTAEKYNDGDTVTFDDTASGTSPITVTNNGTVSPGSVTIVNTNKAYIITGNGAIAGGTSLIKTGTANGALTLGGTNSYTGGTTVSAGTLKLGSSYALGTGSLTVQSGAGTPTVWLDLNGQTLTNAIANTGGDCYVRNSSANPAIFTGPVTIGSYTRLGYYGDTVYGSVGSMTISGTLSGGWSEKQGASLLVLTGANSYTGTTVINGGVVRATDGTGITTSNLRLADGYGVGAVFESTGGSIVRALGTGANQVQILTNSCGFSAYGTPVTVSLGGLGTPVTLVWGALGTTTFSPAALVLNYYSANTNLTLANSLDLNGANRTISVYANVAAISGSISNSTGTAGFTKSGAGTLVLSNANTFNGATLITAGTLALNGSGSLASSPLISVTNGAIFDVSGLTSTFALQTGQSLSNSAASTGTIRGSLSTSSGTVSVSYANGTPSLVVTNGTLTLSTSTVVKVNNTGSALGAGSYLLVSTNTSGLVAGILPAVSVNAGGLAANTAASLALNGGQLYLVVQNITTTSLVSTANPSTYGQSVMFSATVSPAPATAGETISFYDGATAIGTGTNNASGVAVLTSSALAAGPHSLTAVYPGDANNLGSTSSALSQAVNSTTLTITANNTNKVYDGTAFAGGNGVAYAGFVNGQNATVLSGTLIYTGNSQGAVAAGAYAITPAGLANVSGTNYAFNYVSGTLTISQAGLTITAGNTNKVYGQARTLTGFSTTGLINSDTVTGVTLTSSGAAGTATVGAYSIAVTNAAGSGLTNYSISYVPGTLTVSPLVTGLAGTRPYDGTVNAVGSILTVTNAANSDVVTLGGTGVLASAYVGTQAITSLGTLALSGGAGTNYTLLGATGAVVITNAYPGTNLLVSSANPSGYLGGVSFTNILPADATGNVVFASTNGPISTNLVSGGLATSLSVTNLPRGTNVITATYSGDTNYLGSAVSLNQIVTNHPPTATVMTVTCTEGLSVMIALSDIATNWRDVDGDPVELTAINLTTTNGVALFPLNLTTNLDGSYVLATNAYIGYVNPTNAGNDQFAYSISDGEGGTNLGYVDIVISTNVITGQATGIIFTGGGPVTVNFAGIIGYSYGVQRSTNLLDWVTLWTTNAPAGGLFNYTDAFGDLGGNAPSSAYYRLSWVP